LERRAGVAPPQASNGSVPPGTNGAIDLFYDGTSDTESALSFVNASLRPMCLGSAVNRRRLVLTVLAVVVLAGVGVFLFAASGVYSVAASKGHYPWTRWFLEFGMRRSVAFHAIGIETPDLSDRALFERGIGHFQGGCALCHGAPGFPASTVAQQMLPSPPDLSKAVPTWEPKELFWIVKHGLKYTGMPGWPAATRDDEVWALVAFLVQLPSMSAEQYRRLAMIEPMTEAEPAQATARAGFIEGDPIACARCHGIDGQGGHAGGVPRLAGQKPAYLAMTLKDYALGTRPSGIMGPIAAYLADAHIAKFAEYYAGLEEGAPGGAARRKIPALDPQVLQRGGALAAVGDASRAIPACAACHGQNGKAEDKNPRYPALAGQHAAYLEQQLKLWRARSRGGTFDEIMAAAVRNITDEEIRAVSLYYANLKNE
jgi:cytochrome c553